MQFIADYRAAIFEGQQRSRVAVDSNPPTIETVATLLKMFVNNKMTGLILTNPFPVLHLDHSAVLKNIE